MKGAAQRDFYDGSFIAAGSGEVSAKLPNFYKLLDLGDVRYRAMMWPEEMTKQYRRHWFGPEWELLMKNKMASLDFLWSLDVFVYPLGHRFKESWGRIIVEAMLTGCPPLVPVGHHFHNM